jgi:hypothetical protein
MTPQQQIQKIYNETIVKLKKLQKERDNIILAYIKELEEKKMQAIKDSLNLKNK